MAITFAEPGGDATYNATNGANGGFWGEVGVAPAVATDFVHGSHTYSIKFRPNFADRLATQRGIISGAGARISFWAYFVAFGVDTGRMLLVNDSAGLTTLYMTATTGGALGVVDGSNNTVVNSSINLSTGQWYRISLAMTISSTTVNRFELFVDGVSAGSATNVSLVRSGIDYVWFGNWTPDSTMDWRLSDTYIDNSSSLTDTGSIWITPKRPVSNGTANEFTTQIGSGGSGYGSGHSPQVNERPATLTNGWSLSNTTKATEEYTIEGLTVGDFNLTGATIVDYLGWVNTKVNSLANSPVHNIIVGGTATSITEDTGAAVYVKGKGSSTYPAGNTDIGMDAQYTTTPHLTSLFDCGIVFAYIPAVSGPANMKSYDGNLKANIKSMSGNLIANVKSFDGNS